MVESAPSPDEHPGAPEEERVPVGGPEGEEVRTTDSTPADPEQPEADFSRTAVRFGYMRYIGEFSHVPDLRFTTGAKLVIQTKRGIEIGEHVPFPRPGNGGPQRREQVREWIEVCGQDSFILDAGRILREATAADLADYARIQHGCKEKREFCQQSADRRNLPLRIVECECPFGGERIICYFTAAERVDFRSLVKDLARAYRTRIEMRQVGARDEARILGDYETCGREICCKTFLKTLKQVNMRMAKLQKSTLDPTQVSGRCGRLKCCLRYEQTGYEELDKKLPRNGARVLAGYTEGVVCGRQILTQLVQLRTDDGALVTVPVEEIGRPGVPEPSSKSESPSPAPPRTAPGGDEPRRAPRRAKTRPKPAEAGTPDNRGGRGTRTGSRERDSSAAPTDIQKARKKRSKASRRKRGRRRTSRKGHPDKSPPGSPDG